MKRTLIVILLSVASWAQNGGVIPPPDIAGAAGDAAGAAQRAYRQAVEAEQIRQQTKLLRQQTELLKQQNAALKAQQQVGLLASQTPLRAVRRPKIDDLDLASGQPRFANYAEYEEAKDEWLIEEALRRFEALYPAASPK